MRCDVPRCGDVLPPHSSGTGADRIHTVVSFKFSVYGGQTWRASFSGHYRRAYGGKGMGAVFLLQKICNSHDRHNRNLDFY